MRSQRILRGFSSAIRSWWLSALRTCEEKRFEPHRLLTSLVKRDSENKMFAATAIHADDFLVAFRKGYSLSELAYMRMGTSNSNHPQGEMRRDASSRKCHVDSLRWAC